MSYSKLSLKRYLEVCVMIIISLTILVYVNRVVRQLFVKGHGKRMGVVMKITERGWFRKSWEGELFVPSEEVSEGVMNPEVWNFSVSDTNVVAKLNKLVGQNVIVKYKREFKPFDRETLFDVICVKTNNVPQVFVITSDDMLRYPRFVNPTITTNKN